METPDPAEINIPGTREKQPFLPGDARLAAGSGSPASVGANRKILIVDDNPIVVKAFQFKLKATGFNVITATDATEGITAARREKPDAIVLDLHFPPGESFTSLNWDGINILQWLKRYKDVADIPIIILTVEDPGTSKEKAFAAGAAAFFQKPVDVKDFLARLLELIGKNPGSAQAA